MCWATRCGRKVNRDREASKQRGQHLRERVARCSPNDFNSWSTARPRAIQYVLLVGKNGAKLETSRAMEKGLARDFGRINADGASMEVLARVPDDDCRRPVFDRTGLTGSYKFTLTWAPTKQCRVNKGRIVVAPPPTPTVAARRIFSRDQQLGSNSIAQKAPVENLVSPAREAHGKTRPCIH